MRMKCKLMTFLMALLLLPMGIIAQTYQQLWKLVEEAQQKDLPQTAIRHLQEIEVKAQKEGAERRAAAEAEIAKLEKEMHMKAIGVAESTQRVISSELQGKRTEKLLTE